MQQSFIMSQKTRESVLEWISKIAECPDAMKGTPTGAVLEDTIGACGKMIRPGLLMACASLGPDFEKNLDRLYFLGALTELTHMSSLIHDDIIDDAPLRRGKSSIQGKYGKDAAVYAGDFLISRILYWEVYMKCYEAGLLLSKAVENMCIGEINQALCSYDENTTCEKYYFNIRHKTAALFMTACKIGAQTAGCSEEVVALLEEFGLHLGIMFQLRDDLLDYASGDTADGKKAHKDFQDGIYTLPVLIALSDPEGRRLLLPIMEENKNRVLEADEILAMETIVIERGGISGTWNEILSHNEQCLKILDKLPQGGAVEELRGLLSILIKR